MGPTTTTGRRGVPGVREGERHDLSPAARRDRHRRIARHRPRRSPSGWPPTASPSSSTTPATRPRPTTVVDGDHRGRRPGDRRPGRRGRRDRGRGALRRRPSRTFGGVDVVVNAAGIMIARAAGRPRPRRPRPHAPHQHPRQLRRRPAGRPPASARGGAIINFSTLGASSWPCPSYARLRRHQGRRRGDDPDPGPRAARPRHHRQRRRPRPDRDRRCSSTARTRRPIDRIAQPSPAGAPRQPDDIAEVVAFLAGPGRWVNGQVALRQRRHRRAASTPLSRTHPIAPRKPS